MPLDNETPKIEIDPTLMRNAIAYFGAVHQINKCQEELLELQIALQIYRKGMPNIINVREEIVDCLIVLMQMVECFGREEIAFLLSRKQKRLENMLVNQVPKEY